MSFPGGLKHVSNYARDELLISLIKISMYPIQNGSEEFGEEHEFENNGEINDGEARGKAVRHRCYDNDTWNEIAKAVEDKFPASMVGLNTPEEKGRPIHCSVSSSWTWLCIVVLYWY